MQHALPKGEMMHRGTRVDTTAIRKVALLTVEGENDDISGVGQTKAAQTICTNIPENMRLHYMQPDVGHYGVFNGSRFRREIAPRITAFQREHARQRQAAGAAVDQRRQDRLSSAVCRFHRLDIRDLPDFAKRLSCRAAGVFPPRYKRAR